MRILISVVAIWKMANGEKLKRKNDKEADIKDPGKFRK